MKVHPRNSLKERKHKKVKPGGPKDSQAFKRWKILNINMTFKS